MTLEKRVGIWMDHSTAQVKEFSISSMQAKTVTSKFTHQVKDSLGKSENLMHNKEQYEQSEYYKTLAEKIRHYEEVLLFGPTNAKTELLNILRKDHRFEKIKIEVKPSDKMTENQQQAFVRDHFKNKL
jgi:hypothetical protein